MIYTLDATRRDDGVRLRWYFDLPSEFAAALSHAHHRDLAVELHGIELVPAMPSDDFVSGAMEFVAWVDNADDDALPPL